MNWKDAVRKSPHGLAVALTNKGRGLRMMNSAGEIFKIETPQAEPLESSNTKRRIGRLDWQPVVYPLERFVRFKELMRMAGVALPLNGSEPTICKLHEGQRGLQAMIHDWCRQLKEILGNAEKLRDVDFLDPELPNALDGIIESATKMRALL
jgi:hypothetical protein